MFYDERRHVETGDPKWFTRSLDGRSNVREISRWRTRKRTKSGDRTGRRSRGQKLFVAVGVAVGVGVCLLVIQGIRGVWTR